MEPAQVLLIDDDVEHAESMVDALRRPGHICTMVHSAADAVDELRHGAFDVVVTDLVMETETAGLEVLRLAKEHQPDATTIMVTAHGEVATAKAALQGGAYDFIEKPLDLDVFRNLVQRAAETSQLRQQNQGLKDDLEAVDHFHGIVGQSQAMREVVDSIRRVAASNLPVLITGESGTGKELVAAAVHAMSPRSTQRYVTFNAAGQSESLLEDELFGHVRGAYTGAERDREGVFEYADKGTLFLDEIGDMPMGMQSRLLRVLESGEIVRLGANEQRATDVRFVSATNRDLKQDIQEGNFREDLYYRIRGTEIHIPALRQRREDIPLLARYFVRKWSSEIGRPVPKVHDATMLRLVAWDWPGNVRELANAVQRMVVMTEGTLDLQSLPQEIQNADVEEDAGDIQAGSLAGIGLARLEKEAIRQTLALTKGNREQTASLLGLGERTLYRKLKEYGLR